jgi:hypothetical protein
MKSIIILLLLTSTAYAQCNWVCINGKWVQVCNQGQTQPTSKPQPQAAQQPILQPIQPPAALPQPPQPINPQMAPVTPQQSATTGCKCGCVQKWAADAKWKADANAHANLMQQTIAKLEATVNAQNQTILAMQNNFGVKVGEYLAEHPAAAPKPFYIRVNPQAEYKPVYPGQYVTLPLDRQQAQQGQP